MLIILTNPKTAAEYDSLTAYDQFVEVPPTPGGNCNCTSYNGMISNITPCAAKRYVEFGGNLIAKKVTEEEENKDSQSLKK